MRFILSLAGAVALLACACGGSSKPPSTPEASGAAGSPSASTTSTSPSPEATATPTPTRLPEAETIGGVTVKALTVGAAVPLPKDVALYVESGCWGCDAPAAALQRVYRGPDGALRTDDLFRLPGATIGSSTVRNRYITSFALGRGGQDVLVAVCEGPYCGGVASVADGAKVSVQHSADGGVSWKQEATLDGGAWLVADNGSAPGGAGSAWVWRVYRPSPGADFRDEVVAYPSLGNALNLGGQTPANATLLVSDNGPPLAVASDGVSVRRLDAPSSSPPYFTFSMLPAGSKLVDWQWLPDSNDILVSWMAASTTYSAIVQGLSPPSPTFKAVYRWPAGLGPQVFRRGLGAPLDARRWVINATLSTRPGDDHAPVVVDFDAGTIQPIQELADRATGDRVLVLGATPGPFVRVKGAGAGDCLNVRQQPALSSPSFACYGDGVLLQELGQRADADGHRWSYVATPAQRAGWASGEFLETSGGAPTFAGHPKGTRTGIAAVDPVIAALEQSATVPESLIGWQKVECRTPVGSPGTELEFAL